MTHPSREQLMEHLYGESTPAETETIESHVDACPQCREQIATWRGAMKTLDGWALPAARPHRAFLAPAFRWAAAAAILLGLGFVAGRSVPPDLKLIQASVHQEVATQVAAAIEGQRTALAAELRDTANRTVGEDTRRLLTSIAEQFEERRQTDAEAYISALQQLDSRHAEEVAKLREDLSTVAVVADARFDDTQDKILKLANAAPLDKN